MKRFRIACVCSGGIIALALLADLAAPRVVHAITATLVQVVNTTGSPAITQDISNQASQRVHLQAIATINSTSNCNNTGLEACPPLYQTGPNGFFTNGGNAYVVPAGQHLVITSIMTTPIFGTSGIPLQLRLDVHPGNISGNYGFWIASQTLSTEFHPTGITVAPGLALDAEVEATTQLTVQVVVDVEGYLTAS